MKVLITGGAGFIGSAIVEALYASGKWDITVLDILTEQIHGTNPERSYLYKKIDGKCHFIRGDIRDIEVVKDAISDNEYIIHLAAETGTGQSMYRINRYNEVNIMGTSNLLQVISDNREKCCVKKIVLASSRSVYGEGKYHCSKCGDVFPDTRKLSDLKQKKFALYCKNCGNRLKLVPTTEDSKINPGSLYAFTKFSQEQMLKTMCPSMGIDYTILRFQNVYGIGQSLKNPYTGILSIFSSLMLEDKPINIFEDGMEKRDFINVKDIAIGVIRALLNNKSDSEVINLGSGIGSSVLEIANRLKEIYHSNSQLNITGDFRLGDIANNIADIKKAEQLLDFKPVVPFEIGLSEFCQWVKKEEKDNTGYEHSLLEMEKKGMFIRQ